MNTRRVLSIGDYSGAWSKPFRDAGYITVRIDPKLKTGKLNTLDRTIGITAQQYRDRLCDQVDAGEHIRGRFAAILLAPPCTAFASSGSQYWPAKDADGTTADALEIIDACTDIVYMSQPAAWVLENPVGRLSTSCYRPRLGWPRIYVQPHNFAGLSSDPEADRYTKKTGLWGEFSVPALKALMAQQNMTPLRACEQGSWIQKLGGKSERTKELRSMTPPGLAQATFAACEQYINADRRFT